MRRCETMSSASGARNEHGSNTPSLERHKGSSVVDLSAVTLVDEPDQTSLLETLPDSDTWEARWDEEWQVAISRQCLLEAQQRFTSDTYRAFYLRAIEGRPSAEVAHLLGKTVNAVDTATSRVRTFLRKRRPEVEKMF